MIKTEIKLIKSKNFNKLNVNKIYEIKQLHFKILKKQY